MDNMLRLAIAFEAISAVALLILLYIYTINARKLKCAFTFGLVFFAAFLFLNSAATMLNLWIMGSIFTIEGANFAFIIAALKAIGLIVLLYITWRGC